MKILLLVQDWISFYNQAEGLAVGLKQIGIDCEMVLISKNDEVQEKYSKFKPDIVVGIGAWDRYKELVRNPMENGFTVVPWIVSDDVVRDYIDDLNKLDLILTTSNYCRDVFVRDGIRKEKIKILYEAVDPQFWKRTNKDTENKMLEMLSIKSDFKIDQKYDLLEVKKKGIPIILTMGGDVTSKGSQEMIRALAKLNKKLEWLYIMKAWPQAHTFFRGQEEFRLIKNFGLEDRIRYMVVDFSKEFTRDLMNICDIYAAPSRGEGFGLPLVQAAMCEKPVVSIKALSVIDVVNNGETGLLTDPVYEAGLLKADVDKLAKNLEKLITDRELRLSMGKEGRIFAKNNFEPKSVAKKLIDYIQLVRQE